MNHVDFDMTCPTCASSLHWVNSAKPSRTEAVATVGCRACKTEYLIRVQMVAFGRYEPKRRRVAA